MPDLDVTEILSDPDLADIFDVIRRSEVIGANGRPTLGSVKTEGVVGVVTPGDSGKLTRADDSAMSSNLITISTSFRLRAAGLGFQPDLVVYDGIQYTVTAVKRWQRFGAGWVKALAESENASDHPPV